MAKMLVFVLVPYSVGPANVSDEANRLLEPHVLSEDRSTGWFDYLCQLGPVFDDRITEYRLPDAQKRLLHSHVCEVSRLPRELVPHALVTPDGVWHSQGTDAGEEDWPARYSALVAAHLYNWAVAVWAHS